jgi:hypothetical protein
MLIDRVNLSGSMESFSVRIEESELLAGWSSGSGCVDKPDAHKNADPPSYAPRESEKTEKSSESQSEERHAES